MTRLQSLLLHGWISMEVENLSCWWHSAAKSGPMMAKMGQ